MSGQVTKPNGDRVWVDDNGNQLAAIHHYEGPDYYTSKENRPPPRDPNTGLHWTLRILQILTFFFWW